MKALAAQRGNTWGDKQDERSLGCCCSRVKTAIAPILHDTFPPANASRLTRYFQLACFQLIWETFPI